MNFHVTGIWGWLLKPLLSLCMLGFAAGSTAIAGGDDGGDIAGGGLDGGGDEGGAGGEGFGGSGEDEIDPGDGPDGGEDLDDGAVRVAAQQRAAAAQESRLPANVKKALAAVKDTDPKAADILRRAIFAQQAWTNALPGGIRHAREMVQAFDEVGGVEGIRGLQDEAQNLQAELDAVDEGWKNGGADFLAKLAEEDPDAFSRNIPIALEQLRKIDKEGYNATLGRIFHNTLNSSGVLNILTQLWSLAQTNKAQPGMAGIVEGLQQILNWEAGIRELAASQPERKPDREREKLKNERTKFDQDRFNAFKQDVGRDVKSHLENGILREVGKLLKARGVNLQQLKIKEPARFKALVREADAQLAEALNSDRTFQQQKDRLVATRDKARVLRFYQQKIDALLGADPRGPRIAKKVADVFFRGVKPGARPGGGGQQRQAGDQGQRSNGGGQGGGGNREERISKAPEPLSIDRNRTTDDDILDGHAWLKGGKHVRWRG